MTQKEGQGERESLSEPSQDDGRQFVFLVPIIHRSRWEIEENGIFFHGEICSLLNGNFVMMIPRNNLIFFFHGFVVRHCQSTLVKKRVKENSKHKKIVSCM